MFVYQSDLTFFSILTLNICRDAI